MSDQDDALLDEDLGDEEYDLGNDEEEALLADDYEIDRQNSYKGEEETDDVLDLGVTDALDDLEGEDENIEYRNDTDNHNYSEFYKEERTDSHGAYYDNQEEREEAREINYDEAIGQNDSVEQNPLNTGDLREKLQKNVQRKVFVGNGQGLEDDDCDEAEERRNRFQNERIMISPKMNNEIPDSLENVVTIEQIRQPPFRARGRGRGIRGVRGRFNVPGAQANYMPRFNPNLRAQPTFNELKPFRPALLEGRPTMFPRMSSSNAITHHPHHHQQLHHHHHHQQQQQQQQPQQQPHQHQQQQQHPPQPHPPQPHPPQPHPPQPHQHQQQQPQQQIIYQQNNPQISPYLQNGPPQPGAGPHFPEHRPSFNPNQFSPPGIPQGPRMIGASRIEYRPRGIMSGNPMPRFNCPPAVPNFMQNQTGPFQAPMIPGSQGPSLLGNPSLNISANQPPAGIRVNPGVPPTPPNQGPPIRENPINAMMQNFPRMPVVPNQGSTPTNQPPIANTPNFDGRSNFQEQQATFMENRAMYETRPIYNNQPPSQLPHGSNPINNTVNVAPQPTGSHLPNVPMPPGHKILINPHFRGTVQASSDARLPWDSQQQQQQQQPPPQHRAPQLQPPAHQLPQQQPPQQHPPTSSANFSQAPASYQNQDPYGQSPAPTQHTTSHEYQRSFQPAKSDDPYAYFSDVWQENKAQKPQIANKSYQSESTYSRDSYSSYGNKYAKTESTWEHRDSYQEEQRGSSQNYRDRDPPPRPRIDSVPKQRVPSSSNSYHESYDSRPRQSSASTRPAPRTLVKRSPDSHDRVPRQSSPKRVKTLGNRQEFRTVASSNESVSVKKDDDVDPEMREYRKKMEEQKRLREKILQEKENRRKQAAMEKMGDESRGDSKTIDNIQQQDTKPALAVTGVTKDNANPMPARGRGRPVNAQATEGSERVPGVRIVRAIQTVETSKVLLENEDTGSKIPISSVQTNERARQLTGQTISTRRVVIQKPLPAVQKVATTVQKAVSNLQRSQTIGRTVQKFDQTPTTGILKKVPAGNGQKVVVNANRTIVQEPLRGKVQGAAAKTNVQKVVVNALNSQRVVLQKSVGQMKRAADLRTNTVRVENLAASTSESQIRRMCQGIGTLESIHMGDGNATIVFKTQSAALVFHKKYQRKMLDLSLINVRLIQQPATNN